MHATITTEPDLIDARKLRDVFGSFATGVTVVTSIGENGAPVGLVVNSFSSVSLDPPQILWSIGLSSPSHKAFCTHPGFAVNVMGADHKDETMRFCTPSEDKFKDVDWWAGNHGVPVLSNAVATLECETEKRIVSGDHEIFIGRVLRVDSRDAAPLIFHRGQFAQLGQSL
ncbi:FMN reductase (NADH) NtaB [Thalassovita gelatinovora]|uniref:FMN reductase (NADH) NtaB n=1 Tax=Thalassovita gelatinovora TaxID=53501 RepID=A0A0P1G4Q9_THAGE|nr:flavin reductase family protein [Thalassovita gelatinovora]QIZ81599.1 flavin reductase family protein [Thalassovita gelatinovora]CUH68045.1 FMN reductase (NADH) NtaB [Thalassovita gelatinovora]SEQ28167.1 NADH-FMN oxidoreductase RutF, flavin reductase (DIM6/NTAB) family [Thalassovita gelatinovora]